MSHLLDTDWLADFLDGRVPAVKLVATLLPDGLAISVVTRLEIREGILGGRDVAGFDAAFRRFLSGVTVLDVDEAVADEAAAIRLALRRVRRQTDHRALDLLIAATAMVHDLTLVTRNRRHFEDIPGIRLYRAQP